MIAPATSRHMPFRTALRRAVLLCVLATLTAYPTRRGAGLPASSRPWFPSAAATPVEVSSNRQGLRGNADPHSSLAADGSARSARQLRQAAAEEDPDAAGSSWDSDSRAPQAEPLQSQASDSQSGGAAYPASPDTASSGSSGGGSEDMSSRPLASGADGSGARGSAAGKCTFPAPVHPRRVAPLAMAASAERCSEACR